MVALLVHHIIVLLFWLLNRDLSVLYWSRSKTQKLQRKEPAASSVEKRRTRKAKAAKKSVWSSGGEASPPRIEATSFVAFASSFGDCSVFSSGFGITLSTPPSDDGSPPRIRNRTAFLPPAARSRWAKPSHFLKIKTNSNNLFWFF